MKILPTLVILGGSLLASSDLENEERVHPERTFEVVNHSPAKESADPEAQVTLPPYTLSNREVYYQILKKSLRKKDMPLFEQQKAKIAENAFNFQRRELTAPQLTTLKELINFFILEIVNQALRELVEEKR